MLSTRSAGAWLLTLLALVASACRAPATEHPTPPATPPPAAAPASPEPPPAPAPPPPADATERSRTRPERPSRTDTTVDLRRDEAQGGHTIARHVGRTDAQLRARLDRESIAAASTYVDLENAERVVALALSVNERRVQRWVDQRGPRSNLAIRYRARDGLPTGRMLRRGDDAATDVNGAVVVLRWRDDAYYVLTSYPEASR